MTTAPTMPADESLDDMMSAGARTGPRHYFGQITVLDVWDCVLEKGRGKVPFDASYHPAERRNVAITIKVTCVKADGSTYDLDQSDLSSGDKGKLTLSSLKKLGITGRAQLTALAGQYVQARRVETGGKYQAKKASADGKIQPGDWIAEQALEFLALYTDTDACKAAETAFYTPRDAAPVGDGRNVPQSIDAPAVDAQARALLLKSLPMLWTAAQQNPVTFAAMLAANGQYAQHGLTPDCAEVLEATGRDASLPF